MLCLVFLWGNKKVSGDIGGAMGHWALPGRRPCPHIPLLQEQKWQKSANFGFLYFCPLTPTPIPTKNNLVQPLCDFQSCFKSCENIQWCKNTCYLAVKVGVNPSLKKEMWLLMHLITKKTCAKMYKSIHFWNQKNQMNPMVATDFGKIMWCLEMHQ